MFSQGCIRLWGCPPTPFRISNDHKYNIQLKPYETFKMELFVTKIDNCRQLLLTVVPSIIHMFKVVKEANLRTTCQIYSELITVALEERLMLLLLVLNIFRSLFHCY